MGCARLLLQCIRQWRPWRIHGCHVPLMLLSQMVLRCP
uniref:BZIP transcription factor family protein n=1 Tax=Rhizophora mucronata TaxID=61149 RepID=A0A2P2NJ13_RHIMU